MVAAATHIDFTESLTRTSVPVFEFGKILTINYETKQLSWKPSRRPAFDALPHFRAFRP
jgi:hypothetical protein